MTSTHQIFPEKRNAPPQKVRQGILGAFILFSALGLSTHSTIVHADAFGGSAANQEVLDRLADLEAKLASISQPAGEDGEGEAGQDVAEGGADESDKSLLQNDRIEDVVALSYEVLGSINGLKIVKDKVSDKRLLMTETEFAEFAEERKERVAREFKSGLAGEVAPLTLPDPPSIVAAASSNASASDKGVVGTPAATNKADDKKKAKPTARERAEERRRLKAEKERKEQAEKARSEQGYRAQTGGYYSNQNK